MYLDGVAAAYAARTQVMGRGNAGKRKYLLLYLVFHFGRQRLLQQLFYTGHQQLYGYLHNEEAHHHGRQRVEYAPALTQQNGTADAHSRTDGRECVATMMPGVGYHGLRVEPAAFEDGVLVEQFLEYDGHQGCPQGQHAGFLQGASVPELPDGSAPVPQDTETHEQQYQPDDGRSQGFVLAVAVVMPFVFGLGRNTHKHNDDDVRHKVGQRMNRIGQHGGTVPAHTCHKLEHQQQEVHHTSHDGYTVDFLLAVSRNSLIHTAFLFTSLQAAKIAYYFKMMRCKAL